MKIQKYISLLALFVLAFAFAAFAAFAAPPPSFHSTSAVQTAENAAVSGHSVAVGLADTAVVVPKIPRQTIKRKFYGYRIETNFGKIQNKPLQINAIGRSEPDFVPLNFNRNRQSV